MSYVMITILISLAFVCFFVPAADQWLPGRNKYIMGAVIIVYTAIRVYRLRRQMAIAKEQNINER